MKYKNIKNSIIGKNTRINDFVNLYRCKIGNNCMIGTFVEIQGGVVIGNNVKIESHTFICSGVIIEDNVFVGHHVVFINDKYPRSINKDWKLMTTIVRKGASIGSNSTILGDIIVGENAMIGAGSVVTKSVSPNTTVAGVPARKLHK